jgi:diaminopimelate epimerase
MTEHKVEAQDVFFEMSKDIFDCQFQPAVYEGCGNQVLIVVLNQDLIPDYRDDRTTREVLKEMGLITGVDSVLVVTGNPQQFNLQGYHCTMEVFEPRGQDPIHPDRVGSWSTMCGNGIRALAQYWLDRLPDFESQREFSIQTRSGTRMVRHLEDGRFHVYMGVYTDHVDDLARYVDFSELDLKSEQYQGPDLLESLDLSELEIGVVNVGIGLTGDPDGRGTIDGEPHLVCWLDSRVEVTMEGIESAAQWLGERLARRSLFPYEINVSAAVHRETGEILAATYERGVYYVTRACGTGATVIGYQSGKLQVIVQMPGGNLEVKVRGLRTFLIGPARAVKEVEL